MCTLPTSDNGGTLNHLEFKKSIIITPIMTQIFKATFLHTLSVSRHLVSIEHNISGKIYEKTFENLLVNDSSL